MVNPYSNMSAKDFFLKGLILKMNLILLFFNLSNAWGGGDNKAFAPCSMYGTA